MDWPTPFQIMQTMLSDAWKKIRSSHSVAMHTEYSADVEENLRLARLDVHAEWQWNTDGKPDVL